ncbi:MAG TPA: TadE family protein [Sphingomicrobium sp.]|nr:TadE family protein [Sphingomicrobium sp.]
MMRDLASLHRDESGNAFVEMALVFPILATLLLGTVDISRAYSNRLALEQAAQRTVELVQRINYTQAYKDALKSDAEAAAGAGSTATVTDWLQCGTSATKLSYTGSCSAGQATQRFVQVSITSNYTPLFAATIFPNKNADGTVTITAKAGIRVQ